MHKKKIGVALTALLLAAAIPCVGAPRQKKAKEKPRVTLSNNDSTILTFDVEYQASTDMLAPATGQIRIYLYPEANLRDIRRNFRNLVQAQAYDSVLFHRVVPDFVIQAGDPKSKKAEPGAMLGDGGAEGTGIAPMPFVGGQLFENPARVHKYGAVAIARSGDQGNLDRTGSSSQFYIVTADRKYKPQQLGAMAADRRYQYMNVLGQFAGSQENAQRLFSKMYPKAAGTISDEACEVYRTVGGAPFLDEDYTVIGEVVGGMDIAKAIEQLPADHNSRPTGYARILKVTYSGPEISDADAVEALGAARKK